MVIMLSLQGLPQAQPCAGLVPFLQRRRVAARSMVPAWAGATGPLSSLGSVPAPGERTGPAVDRIKI